VIDRCPGGVELLEKIMDSPNMVMLLGNHEQMCLQTLGPHNAFGSRELWKQNGGSSTYRDLVYHCTHTRRNGILRFLSALPDCLEVEVNGRLFHLVHGYPSDDPHTRIWGRPAVGAPAPFSDRTVIVGHTPTCYLSDDFRSAFRIWHGDGIIDIDCGCGHKSPHRRLACLRLEDMEEFYV